MLEDASCQAECRASTTSSVDVDEETASTADDGRATVTSLASYRQPHGLTTSPCSMSSHRHASSPSTISSHSRCSCSRRVTDIRAFSGFYSDGDVDDAVAMETRQQLQRSLRSTTSESGAFRRVPPSRPEFHQRCLGNGSIGHQRDSAPTPRDHDVTDKDNNTRGMMKSKGLAGETRLTDALVDGAAGNRAKAAGQTRMYEASEWLKTAGVDRRSKRLETSDWVSGVIAEARHTGQRRRRGRHVLSVVKSGAGLRAISETGDTCRLANVSSSLAPDVSHPVIRGLYRQPLPRPASSALASASSPSSSSSSDTAAGRHSDRSASDEDSSDDSQLSI